ncbi:uncharacterized protein [Mytilus edulis]|uniref:uncharacterized protein n=1 Tax=Mytilus edulis TaxID=6550 RepID=UPI0039EFA0D2
MSYDINDFENDFYFLLEIKSYLKQYLEANTTSYEDTLRKGIYSKLTDGRSIRLVLPQGREGLRNISLDDINFVGFIGFSKPAEQLTETLKDEVWKIDGKLIEEFSNHGDILAYVTAERTVGGNSGNLVLLKSLEAIKEWTNCSIHHLAIREISPHYYSKVRIHRGRFVNGKTCTYQTLFIDYGFTPPNRFVKIWV